MRRRAIPIAIMIVMGMVILAGCTRPSAQEERNKVRLQLNGIAQAQFAGYYAAQAKGYYDAESLDVTIQPGGADLVPEQIVAGGGAEFGIDWLANLLSFRERGTPLVNIAQVFQYSGTREVAYRTSGITTVKDLRGRKVATWFGGNEYELLATLDKYKINPRNDVTLVQQPFDMNLLINRQVDAAAATTYDEYKQLLDAGAKPEDLVVIDFNAEGTAMLKDGIFVREDWLKDPRNKDVAARFLRASLQGWEYCRDTPADCVTMMLKQNPKLSKDQQTWMMAEVNKLIWGPPAPPIRLGYMDPAAFRRTAGIALTFGLIKKPADEFAYTRDIWEMATR